MSDHVHCCEPEMDTQTEALLNECNRLGIFSAGDLTIRMGAAASAVDDLRGRLIGSGAHHPDSWLARQLDEVEHGGGSDLSGSTRSGESLDGKQAGAAASRGAAASAGADPLRDTGRRAIEIVRREEHAMKVAGLPTTLERTREAIGYQRPESDEERLDRIEATIERLEDTVAILLSLREEREGTR